MDRQRDHKIFELDAGGFESAALEIFRFQAAENPVYRSFLEALRLDPEGVGRLEEIPYLPVRFFRDRPVVTTAFEPAIVFESSGTTGSVVSRHFVKDPDLYRESFSRGFEGVYGPVQDWCILGLLPSYLERKTSSLVFMVNELIRQSGHPQSGFYLHELEILSALLRELNEKKQKTLLIGVSFALLDLAEQYPQALPNITFMETGGMKGRRAELVREELHRILQTAFTVKSIHSEYGMTELLSQAYSTAQGLFHCPPWMKVLVRDDEDPFSVLRAGNGIINVIDLANKYSCSFLATDDAGRLHPDGSFEVLGRVDGSDIRGCNLMVAEVGG